MLSAMTSIMTMKGADRLLDEKNKKIKKINTKNTNRLKCRDFP